MIIFSNLVDILFHFARIVTGHLIKIHSTDRSIPNAGKIDENVNAPQLTEHRLLMMKLLKID